MKLRPKALVIGMLILLTMLVSGFTMPKWENSLYENLRAEIEKQLSLTFGREITIAKVKGILVYQVEVYDIKIAKDQKVKDGTIAEIEKAVINYNPTKFLINNADIIPAITKIDIYGLKADVVREKNGELNVAKLLPQGEEDAAAEPLPFYAKINVKSGTGTYTDHVGFGANPKGKSFTTEIDSLTAALSFKQKGKLKLSAKALARTKEKTARLAISGSVNLTNAQYQFDTKITNLDIENWGWYVLPLEVFQLKSGSANLKLSIATPKPNESTPVAMRGTAHLKNGRAKLFDYTLKEINGNLQLTHDRVDFDNLEVSFEDVPSIIKGKIYNFASLQLDLSFTANQHFDFASLPTSFSFLKSLNLRGKGNFDLTLKGEAVNPKASGQLTSSGGRFFGNPFYGKVLVSYQNKQFKFNVASITLYDGIFTGPITYSLGKDGLVSGSLKLKDVNLAQLAAGAPGIVGRASGNIELNGTTSNLNGQLTTKLKQAETFGQPVENFYADFNVNEKGVALNQFGISSKRSSFKSQGTISKDLHFNLDTSCRGILLKGEGLLGKMQAEIEKFNGKLVWQLNQKFLKNPLKNLEAQGEITLTNLVLGEQKIKNTTGTIKLKQGTIEVDNIKATAGKTVIIANGTVGQNDTALIIKTTDANLADLKILNHLLPKSYHNPKGKADLKLEVSGSLPTLTTLDSFIKLDYVLSGNIANANAHKIFIKNASVQAHWKEQALTKLRGEIKTLRSAFKVYLDNEAELLFASRGRINFDEFEFLLTTVGNIAGTTQFDIDVTGSLENPNAKITFDAQPFKYNALNFDKLKGTLLWQDLKMKTARPIFAKIGDDKFELSGDVLFVKTKSGVNLPDALDLKIKIDHASLSGISATTQKIIDETNQLIRRATPPPDITLNFSLKDLVVPNPQSYRKNDQINFYKVDNKGKLQDCFLKLFAVFTKTKVKIETEDPLAWSKKLGGTTTGRVIIAGPLKGLTIKTDQLKVEDGNFGEFKFNRLDLQAEYHKQKVKLKQFLIDKKGGRFSIVGEADLNTKDLNLKVSGIEFPADSLKLIFPGGKNFEGYLNIEATVKGSLTSPEAYAQVYSSNLIAEDVQFEEFYLDADLLDNVFYLNTLELKSKGKPSVVTGKIPLAKDKELALSASLEGNAIGLVNLITSEIKWKTGLAQAKLLITGKRDNLSIDGNLDIQAAKIYVSALKSTLKDVTASLNIEKSVGKLTNLSANWKGPRTKEKSNTLKINGTLKLPNLLASPPIVYVDLALADTDLTVDLPEIIAGDLSLKNIKIKGDFYLSEKFIRKKGPALAGWLKTSNCTIYLPKGSKKEKKIIYLDYDVILNLGDKTYAAGGETDITKIDLSPIINLEVYGENISVKGNSREPSLFGELNFKRGTVSLFDREFTLISPKIQEKYYPLARDKINDNKAVFNDGEGPEAIIPTLNLTAKVIVDNYTEDAEGNSVKEKITVLSQITGMPYVNDESRGIKIAFACFREGAGLTNIESATFSEDEIRVLLLPDFLKGALGLSDPGAETTSTDVAVDYLASRAQNYLSSTVGRQLEQQLGLESLTLEYNFGRDLRRNIAGSSSNDDEEETLWGVGLAKELVNNLYIDLRYSEALETQTQLKKEYFNYELTYKITNIWSIAYYREPSSFDELLSGSSKTTLKAGFKF